MPKLRMTDAAVRATTADAGTRTDYFDSHPRDRQRGLVLRVSGAREKDGTVTVSRTWQAVTRVLGSNKVRRFTIGDYPTFGLAEARERAAEIVKGARKGIDPLAERRQAARQAELAGKDTVAALVEKFMHDLRERPKPRGGKRAPRYIDEVQRGFKNHVLPRWGSRVIHDITRRDVDDLVRAIAEEGSDIRGEDGKKRHVDGGKIAANRVLAAVRSFFNWALRAGIVATTPAALVERPGEEAKRERVLRDDEIRAIWPQMKAMGYPFGHFFMLALATGQRRTELATMQWAEIDEKNRLWIIPREKTKTRREHALPLNALALDIIAEARVGAKALNKARADAAKLDRIPDLPPYVFSTRGGRPISGYSRAKKDLDKRIANALKASRQKKLEGWVIHDLRRSCATGLGNLGVDPHVIECVLNHVSGFRGGVAGVYNHSAYLPQMRDALDRWVDHLIALTKPQPLAESDAAA